MKSVWRQSRGCRGEKSSLTVNPAACDRHSVVRDRRTDLTGTGRRVKQRKLHLIGTIGRQRTVGQFSWYVNAAVWRKTVPAKAKTIRNQNKRMYICRLHAVKMYVLFMALSCKLFGGDRKNACQTCWIGVIIRSLTDRSSLAPAGRV